MRAKKLLLGIILLMGFAVFFLGCTLQTGNQSLVEIVGTVRWVEIEGGFFGIIADDGTRYEPLNLPGEYQDGTRVHVIARVRSDYASVHMWGTIIEILCIENLG